jgi:hypothetical protein
MLQRQSASQRRCHVGCTAPSRRCCDDIMLQACPHSGSGRVSALTWKQMQSSTSTELSLLTYMSLVEASSSALFVAAWLHVLARAR